MANDKRGHAPEPDVSEVLDELAVDDSTEFLAGPTARNEAGDTKRAAAKATGAMGASKKIDPDLMVDPNGDRVKSGSSAGIHGFHDLPEDGSEPVRLSLSNEEVAESVPTTARKSPAQRPSRADAVAGAARADRFGIAAGCLRPARSSMFPRGSWCAANPAMANPRRASPAPTGHSLAEPNVPTHDRRDLGPTAEAVFADPFRDPASRVGR